MGLNIMGEDSRVERGGRDGRSSSGYSQEQPCKRSKDGEEGRDCGGEVGGGGQQKGAERGVKNVLGEGLGDRVTVPTHEAAKADVRESVWVSLDGRH